MYYAFFDQNVLSMLSIPEILVSDCSGSVSPDSTLEAPHLASAVVLTTQHDASLSEPGRQTFTGSIASSGLTDLQRIARFDLRGPDTLVSGGTIDAELTADGIDYLEAHMTLRLVNVRQPRFIFRA